MTTQPATIESLDACVSRLQEFDAKDVCHRARWLLDHCPEVKVDEVKWETWTWDGNIFLPTAISCSAKVRIIIPWDRVLACRWRFTLIRKVFSQVPYLPKWCGDAVLDHAKKPPVKVTLSGVDKFIWRARIKGKLDYYSPTEKLALPVKISGEQRGLYSPGDEAGAADPEKTSS